MSVSNKSVYIEYDFMTKMILILIFKILVTYPGNRLL